MLGIQDAVPGHYAPDPLLFAAHPAADFSIERIGACADLHLSPLIKQPAHKAQANPELP